MMITTSNRARSLFSHPAIADGYLAAVLLLSLPLWIGFFGRLAAFVNPGYRFSVEAVTAAVLYALAVHLALCAWRKPGTGSHLASAFSLMVAVMVPSLLYTLLA